MSLLNEKAIIHDHTFDSTLPLVGRLRTAWNNIAARWYVRAHFAQQIEFNQLAAQQIAMQAAQLTTQDREIVQLTRTVAELELRLKRLTQSAEAEC